MSHRRINSLALWAILAGSLTALPAFSQGDLSKRAAEFPIKRLMRQSETQTPSKPMTAIPVRTLNGAPTPVPASKGRLEKVEPGKVRWHKAIQTAMDASKQSGKPVLLFQMMGRLDDRFC